MATIYGDAAGTDASNDLIAAEAFRQLVRERQRGHRDTERQREERQRDRNGREAQRREERGTRSYQSLLLLQAAADVVLLYPAQHQRTASNNPIPPAWLWNETVAGGGYVCGEEEREEE